MLYLQAIERFTELFAEASKLDLLEPTAMSLATTDDRGWPSVRTVLLKSVDIQGFVFYTNKLSRKGRQLHETGRAALCFYWQALLQQVLVEGSVKDVTDREADAYWATRARISQIGAWASLQSEKLSSREELEQRFAEIEARFKDQPVPRPPHWSGYRVVPDMIEFWQSRPGRLHERDRYFLDGGEWRHSLIYP
ncbi:MAG TPA: pyridoxamine 5'-phosphate oxidase [Pseudomonadales bacterium]|nr:pyridoxamine 5'-phosphate oxidase [Pseudomonadales bacterium]